MGKQGSEQPRELNSRLKNNKMANVIDEIKENIEEGEEAAEEILKKGEEVIEEIVEKAEEKLRKKPDEKTSKDVSKEEPETEEKIVEIKKEPEKPKEDKKVEAVTEVKTESKEGKEENKVKIIYFVHGTTTDNEKGVSTGQSQGELSELGVKQSKELKDKIKGKKFDVVFSSDLKRAVDSAKIIFGDNVIQDKRLRECNYGDLNQAKEEKVKYEEHIDESFPDGESLKDVEKRIGEFLNEIREKYEGKNVAVVAHKAPQLAFEVLLNKKTWEQAIKEDWRKEGKWQPSWNYEITPEEKIGQKTETKKEEKKEEKPKEDEKTPEKKETIKEPVKIKEKPKKTEALISVENLPISTKHSAAICKYIKNKKIEHAISDLEQVLKFKKSVPMKGEVPHRKGEGVMSGRFPKKAVLRFIILLKSLSANSNHHGIEGPIIVEAISNIGSRPYGRFGWIRKKRTHVRLIAKSKKAEEKKEVKG